MIFLRVQIYTNALVLDFLSRLHRDPYSNLGVVAEFFFYRASFQERTLDPDTSTANDFCDRNFVQLRVGAVRYMPLTQELAAKSVRVYL